LLGLWDGARVGVYNLSNSTAFGPKYLNMCLFDRDDREFKRDCDVLSSLFSSLLFLQTPESIPYSIIFRGGWKYYALYTLSSLRF